MKAWYFCSDDMKLRYGDGREVVVGTTHSVDGEIKLCVKGLHASERLIDALQYAPGSQLFIVELSGKMDSGSDKVSAECRTYLKHIDATDLLREFARKQALINIEKIKPYCSTSEYALIVHYLETGDSAARAAAESAARAAAESAAWSAAESAAWSAARAAAWSAARAAAESAAGAAAWSAAWSAAESAAWSAAESAAWSAAWSAAGAAARSAANDMLTAMVEEAMA